MNCLPNSLKVVASKRMTPSVVTGKFAPLFTDSLIGDFTASINVQETKLGFVKPLDRVVSVNFAFDPLDYSIPPERTGYDFISCIKRSDYRNLQVEPLPILGLSEPTDNDFLTVAYGEISHKYSHERNLQLISPQSGNEKSLSEIMNRIRTESRRYKTIITDNVMREIEGLVATLIALRSVNTVQGLLSVLFLYIRDHFEESVTDSVCGYISELVFSVEKQAVQEQSGHSPDGTPNWLLLMRDVQSNWLLLKGNKMFSQISKLLGVMVTLGLCNASCLRFSIGGFKLFNEDVLGHHKSAFDIVDAIFSTITYFAEGAFMCFKTGSLRPLLINDHAAAELDNEYCTILQMWDYVQNGNLKKTMGILDQEFDRRLENLITSLRTVNLSLKGYDKKLVGDRVTRLLLIKNAFVTLKLSSGIRRAPFVLEFFGESNQGKTTCSQILQDALLLSQDMPLSKDYRGVINPAAKHMDTWRSDMIVAILDDVANEKADFVEQSPARFIIDLVNNEQYVCKKANLEGKGKVTFEAELLCITTNKKTLDAAVYSNCPGSVQRRANVVISVQARKKYQKFSSDGVPLGIDSRKVEAENEARKSSGEEEMPFDDLWSLTLERAVMPEEMTDVASYEPLIWNGRKLINIDMATCIQYLITQFDDHINLQTAVIERTKTRTQRMKRCNVDGCRHIKGNCPEHDVCKPIPDLASEVGPPPGLKKSAKKDRRFFGGKKRGHRNADDLTVEAANLEKVKRIYPGTSTDKPDKIAPHFGLVKTARSIVRVKDKVQDFICQDVSNFTTKVDDMASAALYTTAVSFISQWNWLAIVPVEVFENSYVRDVIFWLNSDKLKDEIKYHSILHVIFLILGWLFAFIVQVPFCGILVTMYLIMRQCCIVSVVKNDFIRDLSHRTGYLPSIVRKHKETYWKQFTYLCGGIVGVVAAIKLYQGFKALTDDQGALEPKSEAEIIARTAERNPWQGVSQTPLPTSDKSKRLTLPQLKNIVKKNLRYCRLYKDEGQPMMTDALFLTSNVVLIPGHYFDEHDDFRAEFKSDSQGGCFKSRISKYQSVQIPGTDVRVCYSPTGGSFKNILEYFPDFNEENPLHNHPILMMYMNLTGHVTEMKGTSTIGIQDNSITQFYGGICRNLSHETFNGLCGAPVLGDVNTPCISGIHLGGISGQPVAVFGALSQTQLKTAITQLRGVEGVVITGQAGVFREEVLGVKVISDEELHPKSCLNFIPDDHETQLQYFGTCPGRVTYKSDVKVTVISDVVEEVTGIGNKWGPPKMNPDWFGWQKCIANISNPGVSFPVRLLQRAVLDYKIPLLKCIRDTPYWNKMKPLSEQVTLCGTPGVRFVDPVKLNTAVGHPLTGSKRQHVIDLEPTEEEPVRREYTPEIREEIAYAEACYERGERAYGMAKACKKDEILPDDKEKCRIFYGNPISLTHEIRKYFLPIIQFIQTNPILTEQAVGINPYSPEWDEMFKNVQKYGKERTIAGDYSKYDQRMPTQMISAALRVCIDCAKEMDYTDRDIRVMEAMVGDIVFAYIAFNGDLIGLTEGGHISGNSLTVLVNGIVGSLNLRIVYYSIYDWSDDFRKYVSLMCYGDDNIGSVHKDRQDFNIDAASEYLAQYGQILTMPDKTSEMSKWCPDADFLKRNSVLSPKLGYAVGALAEDSIFKSLHNYVRRRGAVLTEEQACAQNIDTALMEWFLHGEEVYNTRRKQMAEIAEKSGISHLVTGTQKGYDERVAQWYEDYIAGSVLDGPDYE